MAPTANALAGDAPEIRTGLTSLKARCPGDTSDRVMTHLKLTFRLALGCLLALTGLCAPAAAENGEVLVRRHCGGCHAVGATGDSPEPAAPKFRELHKRYDPEVLGEALAEGILVGHPLMPEFRFAPRDVQSIILYLKTLQSKQAG